MHVCGQFVFVALQDHIFRMPDDRLPKKLLFGQVKGRRPPLDLVSMMLQCVIANCVA